MAERVGRFLRIGITQRGMPAGDLADAWALIRPPDEGARGWQLRLKRTLGDQPAGGVTVRWLHSLLQARPRLDAAVHFFPDSDAHEGETVSFIPGSWRWRRTSAAGPRSPFPRTQGWTPPGVWISAEAGCLRTDAARVLRILAGRIPAGARTAELEHIDRNLHPLRGVDRSCP